MKDSKPTTFPKHFLWGAATAAHQVEGDTHNQWTVWELENARALAVQAEYHIGDFASWPRIKEQAKDPHNYVSAGLADHYHRYKEDFDLLEKMNMNAYRFSIEWSRVEPKEGTWDPAAITHYQEYVRELKRRDIEPVVTLFHFTLPVWFAEKGGFEKRSNVKYFVRFAEKMIDELGASIRYIITINEPEVYTAESYILQEWPPARKRNLWKALRVVNNLARAHKQIAKYAHAKSRRYKVSISKNTCFFYPGDSAWLSRASAAVMQYFQDDYVIKKFIKHCDFLGVNYYLSQRVYGYRMHNPEEKVSDVDWALAPGDIEYALERLYQRYSKPMIITENGLADAEDQYRQEWIKETLLGIQQAMQRGVEVEGYLHWSLMDNFEWAYGKWPRFGLAAVDYQTGKRTLRPSAVVFGRVIKKLRGI